MRHNTLQWAVILSGIAMLSVSNCKKNASQASTDTNSTAHSNQISMRIHHTTLKPEQVNEASLKDNWQKHADQIKSNAEIDPAFTVHGLDWGRVFAFVQGLDRQPADLLAKMKGKTVNLHGQDLMLCTASPYQAEALRSGFELTLGPEAYPGDPNLTLELRADVDTSYAANHILEAKAVLEKADAQVALDEAALPTAQDAQRSMLLERLGANKRIRFSAAHAWRINAKALTENYPGIQRFRVEYDSAQAAVRQYAVQTDYLSSQN